MKKMMLVAVAFLTLGAVIGAIVLLFGGEEKVAPQAKVAKVTITCVPGESEIDFDCDGIADTIDSDPTVPNPDQTDDFVTIEINSKDEQPAEIHVFHAVDSSDRSGNDVSYGLAMFKVRLTKAQACGRSRGIEINARQMDERGAWYSVLGILDRLMVSVHGLSVEPAMIRHPWSSGSGNLLLTPQMLGCNS